MPYSTNIHHMAVVKARYTRSRGRAKANIRYIQHRKGREGEKVTRELFGADGLVNRTDAYRMIDEAGKGTAFFRIVITPDPATEDTYKDLYLQEITQQTMTHLQERIGKSVLYVAAAHDDHATHRHVHVLALVRGRVNTPDLQAMRQTATQSAQFQRQERDLQQQQQAQQQKGAQWAL
jgi:hypothetical protein